MPWKIRARCPKLPGVSAGSTVTLILEENENTTLDELRKIAASAAHIKPANVVMRGGFPPKLVLAHPPAHDEKERSVHNVSLQNGDTVIIERQTGEESAGIQRGAIATTRSTGKGKSKAKMASSGAVTVTHGKHQAKRPPKRKWGVGQALGDSAESAEVVDAQSSQVSEKEIAGAQALEDREAQNAANPHLFVAIREMVDEIGQRLETEAVKVGEAQTGGVVVEEASSASDAEGSASTVNEFYISLVAELMNAMYVNPEKSDEFDPEWVIQALAKQDYHLEYIPEGNEGHEQSFDQLAELFDDASEYFGRYEEAKLAELLRQTPSFCTTFDIGWILKKLGYKRSTIDAVGETEISAWKDVWAHAKDLVSVANRQVDLDVTLPGTADASIYEPGAIAEGNAEFVDVVSSMARSGSVAEHTAKLVKTHAGGKKWFEKLQQDLCEVGVDKDPIKALDRLEGNVGATLVAALSSRGDNAIKGGMKVALRGRENEAKAEAKYKAALAGDYTVTLHDAASDDALPSMTISYKIDRTWTEESVTHLPTIWLIDALENLVQNEDSWPMLMPAQMALRSPRLFWNIVHTGGVGPAQSFQSACESLMPESDWPTIFTRKKKLKYDSLEWCQ